MSGDVRRQLAEALCGCGAMHKTSTVRDRLLLVLHSLADEDFDWADADEFADALLPVVDRIARQRAAEELHAAADTHGSGGVVPTWHLIDRADALTAEAQP